ncbi:MAG: polysaccharide biosynthesis/export family protein [Verrucomicrobia bacterium]|nr:polysaccharide biosynthesis/export family protein [Verrucomicrobiota bacterium]
MPKNLTTEVSGEQTSGSNGRCLWQLPRLNFALMLVILLAVAGCQTQTPQVNEFGEKTSSHSEAVVLREGDVLKISFPGAPNLNTTQPIRRDGKINLPLVGEINAVGMTPAQLEKELVKLYSTQLTTKEVNVAVESSIFSVFITGAVVKPGKISSNRPLTALEAIMEAGGFDYTKANLKAVKVIRNEGGQVKNFTLNLKLVMSGKETEPFFLKPSDIVFVPERFVWF